MQFTLNHTDPHSSARAGTLETDHGTIQTPIFMPVGTAGTVKGVTQQTLKDDTQAQIILGNTYHLYLRPGLDIIEQAGGLHKFNGWDRPLLTDSGGYQVYSLSHRRKISEEGAKFRSHIDGSQHLFTPEKVMDIPRIIGADIIMAFDECPPFPCDFDYAARSLSMTNRWLDRCIKRLEETEPLYGHQQALFPIVQGSTYTDLRIKSAEYCASKDPLGIAIGGLSVGEPNDEMYAMTEVVTGVLPTDKPRYLMGVGTPANLLECISLGVDMFDCVLPTRNARNGQIFTREGIINLRNAKWIDDFSPLDPTGTSFVDQAYTKAYLRHLVHSGEMLGKIIPTIHNLAFYLELVREARERILDGTFTDWKNQLVPKLSARL